MISVDKWLEVVKSWVGTEVRHQGYQRSGVDCSGLLIGALAECGVLATRGFINGNWPTEEQMDEYLLHHTTLINRPVTGCIAQTIIGKQARHLGVYTGEDRGFRPLFIHAPPSRLGKTMFVREDVCKGVRHWRWLNYVEAPK